MGKCSDIQRLEENDMARIEIELAPYVPELFTGQASGRPYWTYHLPLETLQEIDALANDALKSEDGLKAYIQYTRFYRENPRVA